MYSEYGYTTPALQHKYTLDYLVPLALGGSTSIANIWPASMRGVGFFQKQQLNAVLFGLVCHGAVPLVAAQRQIANDWYSAWLRTSWIPGGPAPDSNCCIAWADPVRRLVFVYPTDLLTAGHEGARHQGEIADTIIAACA